MEEGLECLLSGDIESDGAGLGLLGEKAFIVPPAPRPSQDADNARRAPKKAAKAGVVMIFKDCKLCKTPSDIRKNQVYCTINECKKIIDNAENHAKQAGELEFFRELKHSDDPEPFIKFIFSFKRSTGGGIPGQGNRCSGKFDFARWGGDQPVQAIDS